jgi:hypothetical protein
MPTYSFGVNSILKVELSEEQALRYNRFLTAFFDAQTKLSEAGTPWDPKVSPILEIEFEDGDDKVYNEVARKITTAINAIDQDKTPIEIEDDFLIRN